MSNILFLGGSILGSGGIDRALEVLASPIQQVCVESVVFPKATLEQHWHREETQQKLTAKPWDVVVLQEQGLRPLEAPHKMQEYTALFSSAILQHGARPLLFIPWRRREHKASTWRQICDVHQKIAQELKLAACYVGAAWERALLAAPDLVLLERGTNHASASGAVLTAACLVLSLFEIMPSEGSLRGAGLPAVYTRTVLDALRA